MEHTELDFSDRKNFPGTSGNFFDILIHTWDIINRIPAPLYALVLLAGAFLSAWFNWQLALIIWAFFLLDWLLLSLLPVLRVSHGPAKPPVLMLAGMRGVIYLIPFALPIRIAIQLIGTALVAYGFIIEPRKVGLTRKKHRTAKINTQRPITLLHLGDLHVERITTREKQLLDAIETLQPDLIVFTGDILNLSYLKDPQAHAAAREIMAKWNAPLGVYGVSGSPAVDLEEIWPDLTRDLPVHWLHNEQVRVNTPAGDICITGMYCSHKPFVDTPELEKLAGNLSHDDLNILLYHSPDLAPAAARLGFDMQFSGHTHGGQVRLPFYGALFTASLYGKRYESGQITVGDMVLYVTRGIGLEGSGAPRVRLFCPPEIILWEIGAGV